MKTNLKRSCWLHGDYQGERCPSCSAKEASSSHKRALLLKRLRALRGRMAPLVGSHALFGSGADRDYVLSICALPFELRDELRANKGRSTDDYPSNHFWSVRDGHDNYIVCNSEGMKTAFVIAHQAAAFAVGGDGRGEPNNPIGKALCEKAGRKWFFRAVMTALGYPDRQDPPENL